MKPTWIVVADEGTAKIVAFSQNDRTFELVEQVDDTAGKLPGRELRRDAVGRRGGTAHSANATASAGLDESHKEAISHARDLLHRLATARREDRYDTLLLVAAPRFLGLLRNDMPAELQPAIVGEVSKDLVGLPQAELFDRLLQTLRDHDAITPRVS